MSIYTDRWNAVHELFMDHIVPAFDDPSVDVLFDGQQIFRDQLIIVDQLIEVVIGNCTYTLYNGDPEYDEGAYDLISDTEKRIRSNFKIYKRIDY